MRIATDLALSLDGDLVIRDNDLAIAGQGDFQKQSAINRIKSIMDDWRYDHIGADLEDIIGKPNTLETAKEGVDKITVALTEDGLFNAKDIYVKPTPVSKTQLYFFIFINSQFFPEPFGIAVSLDLSSGAVLVMEG